MADVQWTVRADADLEQIAAYIGLQKQNPSAADRLLDALFDKADAYARQKGMGTLHEEFEPPAGFAGPIRSFRVKRYLGFYVERPDGIIVLRVIDGRRDYGRLFG